MEPFEYVPTICRECWTVTADLEKHELWHRQVSDRISAAYQAGYSASLR